MKLTIISSVIVSTVIFLQVLVISCKPIPDIKSFSYPQTDSAPVNNSETYKFETGSLSIIPQEAKAGSTIIVSLPVRNAGSSANAFIATLYVDGHAYDTEDVTLQPGNSGSITFLLTNLVPGNHVLSVAGIEGYVRVYSLEKYSLTNNRVFLPHYTALEYTPAPPLPYISLGNFSPPVTPFIITQISFRYPYPQSFQILDNHGNQLYRADINYKPAADVPSIEVAGDFTIQMQTSQPTADIRAQLYGYNAWSYVIAYYWPEVSVVEGVKKRFGP